MCFLANLMQWIFNHPSRRGAYTLIMQWTISWLKHSYFQLRAVSLTASVYTNIRRLRFPEAQFFWLHAILSSKSGPRIRLGALCINLSPGGRRGGAMRVRKTYKWHESRSWLLNIQRECSPVISPITLDYDLIKMIVGKLWQRRYSPL